MLNSIHCYGSYGGFIRTLSGTKKKEKKKEKKEYHIVNGTFGQIFFCVPDDVLIEPL